MRRWEFIIWFEPNEDTGETYELEKVRCVTKPMTMTAAQDLAVKEAEKYWPHYSIELNLL